MDITYDQAKQPMGARRSAAPERQEPCARSSLAARSDRVVEPSPRVSSSPTVTALAPQVSDAADATDKADASDEARMVQQLLAGDQRAFQEMYRHYAPLLFKRLLRLVGSAQHAEECLQQVFVEVVDKMHAFRGEGTWHAWLNKITTHVALHHFRRHKRRTSFLQGFGIFWRQKYKLHEGDAIPESYFVQEERKQQLHNALDQLDPRKRIVILLCDLEGIALADVAQQLDIPKGTVASRLHHGRQQLRYLITEALRQQGVSAKDWIHD